MSLNCPICQSENVIVKLFYYLAVAIIFFATDLLGGGMDQTIVCKKRKIIF